AHGQQGDGVHRAGGVGKLDEDGLEAETDGGEKSEQAAIGEAALIERGVHGSTQGRQRHYSVANNSWLESHFSEGSLRERRKPMHFDLADLRLLAAIASSGSLSKAAASIPVAVSAASTRLRQFEERCGLALFTRTAAGMTPTPAGRLVLERARNVLGEAERLKEADRKSTRLNSSH